MKKIFLVTLLIFSISFSNEILGLHDPFASSPVTISAKISYSPTSIPVNLETFYFSCEHRSAEQLQTIINKLYPGILSSVEHSGQTLVIRATRSKYNQLLPLLKKLDSPLDNILIEIKAVELNQNELAQFGIEWEQNVNGTKIANSSKVQDLIQKISFLIGTGKGNLLANPKLSTICGQEAIIQIGDRVPYALPVESANGKITWQINYLESGVLLKIRPEKSDPEHIVLKIKPSVSSIKQWKQTPAGEYPIISRREVETILRVKDGETFALGGLLNEEERQNIQKIPFLGDLPLMGWLFSYNTQEKAKSDVIFLVTASKL